MRQEQDESLKTFISRFRTTNTNVRDPNPDTTLKAFKSGISDRFIGRILLSQKNLTLNEAYQITLGIAKSDKIRQGQKSYKEQPRSHDKIIVGHWDNKNDRPSAPER